MSIVVMFLRDNCEFFGDVLSCVCLNVVFMAAGVTNAGFCANWVHGEIVLACLEF